MALHKIVGDALGNDGAPLPTLVWAAAWHATNVKYGGWHGQDWEQFCSAKGQLKDLLKADDLCYHIQWFIWNCAWVKVHECQHNFTLSQLPPRTLRPI